MCQYIPPAAWVTWMQSKLCRVAHPGWRGGRQGDTMEPTASPVMMGLLHADKGWRTITVVKKCSLKSLLKKTHNKTVRWAACSRANRGKKKPRRSWAVLLCPQNRLWHVLGWILEERKSSCHLRRFAQTWTIAGLGSKAGLVGTWLFSWLVQILPFAETFSGTWKTTPDSSWTV